MKKTLVCLALCAGLGFSAFANVEMLLNFDLMPVSSKTITQNGVSEQINQSFGFGAMLIPPEFNFFFGSPVKFLDIGMNLQINAIPDLMFGSYASANGESTEVGADVGFDGIITIGPVVRFNLGRYNSLLISPGIGFGYSVGAVAASTEENASYLSYTAFSCVFDLDLGYRVWCVSRPGFSFGFSLGTDLSFPLYGTITLVSSNYDSSYGYSNSTVYSGKYSGFDMRIYFGVVWNFGNRSIDRF